MRVEHLAIPGLILVEPVRHGDARGFFSEVFHRQRFAEAGIPTEFVQDNHSLSREKGVVRGLHFQLPPHAQGKLVRVTRGAVLDVAVDLRQGSPSHGRHEAVVLSAENWLQLWIPAGFAHGFVTLEPETEILYKVDAPYNRDADRALRWNDPVLDIDWGVAESDAILSDKDRAAPLLADLPPAFRWER
jgi:dTDP-4-dehydrorhamnose 3,5-epimerase